MARRRRRARRSTARRRARRWPRPTIATRARARSTATSPGAPTPATSITSASPRHRGVAARRAARPEHEGHARTRAGCRMRSRPASSATDAADATIARRTGGVRGRVSHELRSVARPSVLQFLRGSPAAAARRGPASRSALMAPTVAAAPVSVVTHGTPCIIAARRTVRSSKNDSRPSGVLMTSAISPLRMRSPTCGRPSLIL